jgi:DNA-binding phage protein
MPSVSHDEVMARIFREDPEYASALLNDILKDETATLSELLIVLRQMTNGFGDAGSDSSRLFNMLSAEVNPSFHTLVALLRSIGLSLSVAPRKAATGLEAPEPEKMRA